MVDWQTGYVEVRGIRLHYTRTGGGNGGKPPVVLVHGFSDDGPCWTPVAHALEGEYDVIMPDARGHGRSDAPESGYGVQDLADDLQAFITALGLRRPAILGHSMGGATTMVLAGMYPETPGAILIEDAGGRNLGSKTPTEEEKQRWEGMRSWVMSLQTKTRDELLAEERTRNPRWSDIELETWADAHARLSPNVLNRADAAPVDWQAILPNIACPALLITADPERGAMVTPEGAKALQGLIPHLHVAYIPGAGHSVRRDQFAPYVGLVRDFLAHTVGNKDIVPSKEING